MRSYTDFLPTLRFQRTLALSPDGRYVAYVDDANGQFNLTVQSLTDRSTPDHLTAYIDQTVRSMAWSPDGNWLVFEADAHGDEKVKLYRIATSGGAPELLTDSPDARYELPVGGPFSPDGGRLAFAGNDRTPSSMDVLIHDFATGQAERAYTGGGQIDVGHWSPGGIHLTLIKYEQGYDQVVFVVPADGGTPVQLTPDDITSEYRLGPWLPDGTGFLVRTNVDREFIGLACMDAQTGKITWLDTPDWDVEAVALSADGRTMVWIINVDGVAHMRARDLTTGEDLEVPALPPGRPTALAVSRDGSHVALLMATATRPWNVAMIDLRTRLFRWVTDSRPASADISEMVEPTLIRFPTHDGRQIPGLLYRPPGVGGRVGVVLSIHGGPVHQERPAYIDDGFYQYLLSCGVAVLAPNPRGSSGYGKTFQKLVYRDWGGGDLGDFAAAAQYLKAQEWVDPDRIGLYGSSYGGFGVLSCLARLPEMNWGAAVDFFGPSNLVTLGLATPPAYRSVVKAIIGDPEEDTDFLLSRSPITYADQIGAPLLVIQGANDRRVPKSESDQLVERLRAHDVEVRYELYSDEGHGFSKRENHIKALSEAADFLISHLKP